jgi:hypothetical protein
MMTEKMKKKGSSLSPWSKRVWCPTAKKRVRRKKMK